MAQLAGEHEHAIAQLKAELSALRNELTAATTAKERLSDDLMLLKRSVPPGATARRAFTQTAAAGATPAENGPAMYGAAATQAPVAAGSLSASGRGSERLLDAGTVQLPSKQSTKPSQQPAPREGLSSSVQRAIRDSSQMLITSRSTEDVRSRIRPDVHLV